MNTIRSFVMGGLSFVVAGCATTTPELQIYDGNTRPQGEVSHLLFLPQRVTAIDGRPVNSESRAAVLPGDHTALFNFNLPFTFYVHKGKASMTPPSTYYNTMYNRITVAPPTLGSREVRFATRPGKYYYLSVIWDCDLEAMGKASYGISPVPWPQQQADLGPYVRGFKVQITEGDTDSPHKKHSRVMKEEYFSPDVA